MSITAAELIALVKVSGADEAAAKLLAVGGSAESAGGKLTALAAGAVLVAGGALVGIGVTSIKMAADFQQATLSLVAHAGLATDQINNVSRAVLAMAPTVGRSPIELAEALYPILSAFSGITNQSAKTTLSLSTLKMAFETVAGTTVDGTAVANAAVGTFNALGLATNNAGTNAQRMTNLFDVMDKTVQLGNMTWDQYKNVIAKVATSSNTAHVSFNEASAALATLTSQGMNVQKAGTYLVNTFNTLEIKTDLLAARAKKLGISFDESKYASMNLADKIKYLNEVTDGNTQKLLALMGNNSTALQTFEKLSTGVNTYRADLEALNHSQGALKSSFDTAAEGFNFHAQQLKAAFDVLFIKIGTELLPVLSKLMEQVTPLVTQFSDWIVKSGALNQVTQGLQNTISTTATTIQGTVGTIRAVIGFYQQWKPVIDNTAIALAFFFTPALIKAGIEAVISGAKITYSFVTGLIATGFAGWSAAFALAADIAAFIATGTQAGIAGALIAGRFVVSLVTTAATAYATAFALTGSVIPALYAMGVATTVALGPLGVLIAVVGIAGLAFMAMKQKSDEMNLGVSGDFDTMGNKIQRSTGRIIATADQMKNGVTTAAEQMAYDAANSAQQMDTNVTVAAQSMAANTLAAFGNIKNQGGQSFADLLSQVDIDMATLDANAKQYWADVMGYIENNPIQGHITYTTAGGGIGVQQSATTGHNAGGTDNWSGGWSWVGERGPELMNIPRGAQIIPHDKSVAASSGAPINLHVDVILDGTRMTGQLMPRIVQQIRQATGVRF